MSFNYGFPKYRPVADRRARSAKKVKALRKKGQRLDPIAIEGRTIAKTFWGKAWCKNLEHYSDFANRLPRGRSYVRHGAVLDLKIHPGRIDALVDGSHTYEITIQIKPLAAKRWQAIRAATRGEIDSLVELLEGRLSKAVMQRVTCADEGLFPTPKEITLACSCPDWADMCKHVAAVLYGIGARLDETPKLLFTLRKVDPAELIEDAFEERTTPPSQTGHHLDDADLASIFGSAIDFAPDPLKLASPPKRRRAKSPKKPKPDRNPEATALLALIAKHPGERAPALAKRVGRSPAATRSTLAQLRKKGAIHFQGAPRTGGYFAT